VRILVYWPFTRTRGIVYLLLSIIVLPAYMLNLATALSLIGLSSYYSALVGFLITIISLVMSSIHVVIYEVNTTVYTPGGNINNTLRHDIQNTHFPNPSQKDGNID